MRNVALSLVTLGLRLENGAAESVELSKKERRLMRMYSIEPMDGQGEDIVIQLNDNGSWSIKGHCRGLKGFQKQMEILEKEGILR